MSEMTLVSLTEDCKGQVWINSMTRGNCRRGMWGRMTTILLESVKVSPILSLSFCSLGRSSDFNQCVKQCRCWHIKGRDSAVCSGTAHATYRGNSGPKSKARCPVSTHGHPCCLIHQNSIHMLRTHACSLKFQYPPAPNPSPIHHAPPERGLCSKIPRAILRFEMEGYSDQVVRWCGVSGWDRRLVVSVQLEPRSGRYDFPRYQYPVLSTHCSGTKGAWKE